MRLYLADLGHNLLTLSSDVYPLGIANLATWLEAKLAGPGKAPLEIRLFREPQDLKRALDEAPPDVLGLSNYAWNEELSYQFARYAKRRRPEMLTCMGGPNFPLTFEVQESFLRGLPAVDVYVDGPTYEGERAMEELVRRWLEVGQRHAGLHEAPIPGCHFIHPRTGEFVRGPDVPRIRDLDEIPSPYLAGYMDPWYATGYFPMLQITRGCPFSCTFCNSGVRENNKAFSHSAENVRQDLLHVAERVKPEITLCFADDNFGMYELDVEVADYIGWLQDRYGWPKYIRTTTGKNKSERIIQVMRKVHGAMPMTSAVQSMNPTVLKNIKRANIKLETYADIQKELHAQGMQSYGELILCLPGETKASFHKAIEDFLDAGAKRISAHQLMLLHGAELANPESRREFRFDTRFRVVARNIGNYTGEPVIEVEEMVVATPDFSFQDYLETRVFHLLLTVFYYEGNFEEAFEYARATVKPYDLIVRMQRLLPRAPAEFRRVIDDFVRESQEELFPTRQACLDWSLEHYEGLVDGSLGGNLLSKYSMLGRFYATKGVLEELEQTIRAARADAGVEPDSQGLRDVMGYLRAAMLHVPFAREMDTPVAWEAGLDVEAWTRDGHARALEEYRFASPTRFEAHVEPDRKSLIRTKVETFGEHPSGLGKFTRTMFARDLRRTFVRPPR